MLESKDSAIKLFGMKIPLSSVLEAAQEEDDISTQKNQSEKDKTLKKPTKILPCPRCKSMETKFCYYNNYNVNQPRHFCKACQRYWTSGGTMRSVPVGAGRRKNKNSSPHYHRHIAISEETNGPVLSFNIRDEQNVSNKEDCSDKTSTARNIETNGLNCFPPGGVSWPYTCHPTGFYPVYPYWNVPMLLPPPHYSTLGKHPRDENERNNGSVLVPKTLRIDDPNEAAKSSIWTTLGIKKEISMFKGFDSKKEVKINRQDTETSLLLSANPAAFSRSLNFHEQRM